MSLLVDDGIYSNRSFTRLTVTDDQFSLSTSNREHGVDGKNTSLQRNRNGLSVCNTGCFPFNRVIVFRFNRCTAINRSTQCVNNSANQSRANADTGTLFGTHDLCTFYNSIIRTEQNDTNSLFFQVLNNSTDTGFKFHQFAVHGMLHPINGCNAIADPNDRAAFLHAGLSVEIRNFTL